MPPKPVVTVKEGYLYAINIFYFIVSIIIIAVAGVAKGQAYIATIGIIGGVIAVGVFLLIISILGVFAAWQKKRGVIFAYMILLALLFIIQFSVCIAVLAFNETEQKSLVEDGWCGLDDSDKNTLQRHFECYGLYSEFQDPSYFKASSGPNAKCMAPGTTCLTACWVPNGNCTVAGATTTMTTTTTSTTGTTTTTDPLNPTTTSTTTTSTTSTSTTSSSKGSRCTGCYDTLQAQIQKSLRTAGGVGLGFAFTEILGIVAAYFSWRQSKTGDANYRAFL